MSWFDEANRVDHAVAIEGIRRKGGHLKDDAIDLMRYVHILDRLPDFDTEAEEQVDTAIDTLTEILLAVKLARNELKRKRPIAVAAE